MKTPLDTRGSRANDGGSARLGKKQPGGTHAHRIAHPETREAAAFAPPGASPLLTRYPGDPGVWDSSGPGGALAGSFVPRRRDEEVTGRKTTVRSV
jgi:hypothetical protein